MLTLRSRTLAKLVIGTCIFGAASTSYAVFDPGVGIGVQYTDNAGLTNDNEQDDIILIGYAGFSYDESTGPFSVNTVASLVYEEYTDNTFSDQYYWDVDANAVWDQIRNRLSWVAQNRFSQRKVDALTADTPDNNQDTNIFSFGPNLTVPLTGRQTMAFSPAYRRFYYEDTNTDNDEYSLTANWDYQLKPSIQIGLLGNVAKTEFDDQQRNPDLVSSSLQAVLNGTRASSQYQLAAGVDYVQRDNVDDQDGFRGSLDWMRNLTGISDIRLFLATRLTDASNDAFDANNNQNRGNLNNVQVNGDVFRDDIIRTQYSRNGSTLQSQLWVELRQLDYKESPNDREIIEVGLDLKRPVSPRVRAGVYGLYNRTEETDIDRTDDQYVAGGDLTFQMSAKLRALVNLQYQTKDSDNPLDEYDEFSGFIGLIYGFGNVSRVGNAAIQN